jgi:indolepyruvate ferredoxin oxidoreductase beta subunit
MIDEYNIVITGVGGQGVLTASKILGWTAIRKGMRVRVGEVHGLSQRFGTVVSYVRVGTKVYGAMVPEGKGDLMIALEPVEALRYIYYMKRGSKALINNQPLPPVQVSMGLASYPPIEDIRRIIEEKFGSKVFLVNATEKALEVGDVITLNVVMLGAACSLPDFPIECDEIKSIIKTFFPEKLVDTNIKALELGRQLITKK